MSYQIRNHTGQEFRNVTLFELNGLLRNGTVLPSDLAWSESRQDRAPVPVGVLAGRARVPHPARLDPPDLDWLKVMVFGILSGGYLLNVPALIYGIWSWRVKPKLAVLILPATGLILPPAHLLYAIALIRTGEQSHVVSGLAHLIVGFFAVEAISLMCAIASSLMLRRTLLSALREESGLRMNLGLTILLSSAYICYKGRELRHMYK
jgi:hypothetical protein